MPNVDASDKAIFYAVELYGKDIPVIILESKEILVKIQLPDETEKWVNRYWLTDEAKKNGQRARADINTLLLEAEQIRVEQIRKNRARRSPRAIHIVRAKSWDTVEISIYHTFFVTPKINFVCGNCSQYSSEKGIRDQYGWISRVKCGICGALNYL